MPIQVKCNRAIQDGDSKQRRRCGHTFAVNDSLAGKVIRCPSCRQGVEVNHPRQSKSTKSPVVVTPLEPLDPLANRTDAGNAAATGGRYRRVVVCSNCGQPVSGNACQACGNRELKRSDKSIRAIKPQPAGMQRWLIETIDQALPTRYLVLMMHAGVSIIVTLIGFAVLVSLSREALSVVAGVVVLLMLFALTVGYLAMTFKGYQFLFQPGAGLAWFQKPFWSLILSLARRQNWKDYDSRLAKRNVVVVDDKDFQDEDLKDLDGLRAANVLDLEGTDITDQGLEYLYSLKQLNCLVLRGTNVSPDEVYRFQQAMPRVWIWC